MGKSDSPLTGGYISIDIRGVSKVLSVIAANTLRDLVRDKILYNTILCTFILLGVSFLASRLTFIHQSRLIMDFGLTILNLSTSFVAIFSGAVLIAREVQRRTLHLTLSKPISREIFLMGKFLGTLAVLFLNWLVVVLVILLLLKVSDGSLTQSLFWAMLLVFLQGACLAAIATFFSTFSTVTLSSLFCLGIYLIGNNVSQLRFLAKKADSTGAAFFFKYLAILFPNLEHFNLSDRVTYSLTVDPHFIVTAFSYGIVLIFLFLFLSVFVFRLREF